MTPTFEFSRLAALYQEIPSGVAITVELICCGGLFGIAFGISCAWVRALEPAWLKP